MKKTLVLARKHPRNFIMHGKHKVRHIPHTFELTKEEAELLETAGPKHWIKEVAEKEAKPVPEEKKELTEKQRLQKDLADMGVKLTGKETVKQLEEKMLKEINK